LADPNPLGSQGQTRNGRDTPSNDRMKRTAPVSWSAAAYPGVIRTPSEEHQNTTDADGREDERIRAGLAYVVMRRRLAVAACFVLAIPIALLGGWITGSDIGAVVGMAICMVLLLVSGTALFLTQCPKCRSLVFLSNRGWQNTFASKCLNCGFSIAMSDAARKESTTLKSSSDDQALAYREEAEKRPDNNQMQRTRPAGMEPRR